MFQLTLQRIMKALKGSGRVAHYFFNLCIRWGRVFSATPRPP
jgi:hypothetical protein